MSDMLYQYETEAFSQYKITGVQATIVGKLVAGVACLCMHLSHVQLCPIGINPVSSSLHEIFQARILERGYPYPSPGDLPNLAVQTALSYLSCIGRWVLVCGF